MTIDAFRRIALSFPEASEQLHFEKPSFRVKKKIFATLWVPEKRAVVKLTPEDQSVFNKFDPSTFFPVPGAWGRKGWTMIALKSVRKDMLLDALTLSYKATAPKKLAELVDGEEGLQ